MSERRSARPPPRRSAAARVAAWPWHSIALGAWWAFLAVVVPTGVWTLLGVAGCT